MIETHFQKQLSKLQNNILNMSSLIEEQVKNVLKAVVNRGEELIAQIVATENLINNLDNKIEKQCLKLVVLHQPVALDLRIIFSAITINNNLERIGDLTVKIAEGINAFNYTQKELELIEYSKVAVIVKKMVVFAIASIENQDVNIANKIIALENELNTISRLHLVTLKEYMKNNSEQIDASLTLYEMLYSLERIGDLTTNIAEEVYFISEAENIRHKYEASLFENE